MLMFARNLLAAMTTAYPPDTGRHHALTLNDLGQLQLTLCLNGEFVPIIFETEDFDRSLPDLIDEIARATDVG